MARKATTCLPTGTEMRNTKLMMELEGLAERLGISVVRERLVDSRSGLCRLHDQYILFIEKNLKEEDQVEVLIAALSRFSLDNYQVLPGVRRMLTDYQATSHGQG